ncbi:hypothetical protein [Thermococcus celer]|uniref:hypothetical protein n=1 Tax=Thermococcus celer TaxID=2264 RepID=UPI0012FF9039|nr:hypothetical protein [Thermococcus celer]
MKQLGGIWLITLLVGMSVSTALFVTPVAGASNDPYNAFWGHPEQGGRACG